MPHVPWFLCVPAFVSSLTFAQESRPVGCRLLWFDASVPAPVLMAKPPDGAAVRCPIAGNKLSPVFQLFPVDGSIQLLDEKNQEVVAVAKIPADVKQAILVILPAPKAAAGAPTAPARRVYVVDESAGKFPDGGALVANFYHSNIRFVMGEHRNQLPAGASRAVKQPEKRDAFNMAPVMFQFQSGESWRTASESTLRFIPGIRYLILAYIDPSTARPRVATFTDNTVAEPIPAD